MLAITVGTRVRALYPNESWGEGVVVDADERATFENHATGRTQRRKPYVVRRDDGTTGHFDVMQIISLDEDTIVHCKFIAVGDHVRRPVPNAEELVVESVDRDSRVLHVRSLDVGDVFAMPWNRNHHWLVHLARVEAA